MAFRTVDFSHLAQFNSAASSRFIEMYETLLDKKIIDERSEKKNRTIAPSGMYCHLQQWFRLRGTEPDVIEVADRGLDFTAQVGTACHEVIQANLETELKHNWLSVPAHLQRIYSTDQYECEAHGHETRVFLYDPPVKFAVDGLIMFENKVRLLEIKTSDHSSFESLTNIKPQHLDQVTAYCALLQLDNALVLYQDRMYGDFKCFEIDIPEYKRRDLINDMKEIVHMAECNLAPEGLPKGDSKCSPNMCPYYKKCKQWRV